MRREERAVLQAEKIDDIIRQCKICRLGFCDNGSVYIVPLNFGFAYEGGTRVLYFHGAAAGRKFELLTRAPSVGFEMDTNYQLITAPVACGHSASYQSIIGTGEISLITEEKEKQQALQHIMAACTGKADWQFAAPQLAAVCVFKLTVQQLSCKENAFPQMP